MALKAGLDEAGRGSLLGNLVVAIVVCNEEQETFLKKSGVKDSKRISPQKREKLYELIRSTCLYINSISISSREIDNLREGGKTLNQIELDAFLGLCSGYEDIKKCDIYVDSVDVKCERFGKHFTLLTDHEVFSKHKADSLYICVSAASIVAKVLRDRNMQEIRSEMAKIAQNEFDVGSGYPSDTKTKKFVKKYKEKYDKFPLFMRRSWNIS